MKNFLRTMFPAVLLLIFLSGSALAQTKVATVDMRQLFDNYWKTKQVQAAIQDSAAQLDKDDKGMKDDLKKASDDYQQLLAQANDLAISADERDRRKQAAADKLKQLEDHRTAIDQYERQAQATLEQQRQQFSEKILTDIQMHVTAAAKAGGYTIVLNTAAEGINLGTANINVPSPVIYNVGGIDLTADVLKQLNAGAPIDLAPAGSTPAASPAPLPLNTNSP
jgi:Skp family chaperone for outer membrane proteins